MDEPKRTRGGTGARRLPVAVLVIAPVVALVALVAMGAFVAMGTMGAQAAGVPAVTDPAGLLERVQAWLDGTRDLDARFEQQLISGAFGAGVVERGRVRIERPGRMRWDYDDPEPKVALIDGDLTWLYLDEDRELILGRLDRDGELLPALLAGEARLAGIFRPEAPDEADRGADGSRRLRLVPIAGDESFEQVVLTLRPPDYALEAAEVLDASGSRIVYRFGRLRRNRGIEAGAFRLEPGPGVAVRGSHGPAAGEP